MAPNTLLILIDDVGYRVGYTDGQTNTIETVDWDEDSAPGDISQSIVDQLSHGDDGINSRPKTLPRTVVLGVPPAWCLCGTVAVPDLPPHQRRNAMTFALEAKLPISIDTTVVDFIVGKDTALGIAVQIDRLGELIDALEDHGLKIYYICPTALLAVQHVMDSEAPPRSPFAWRGQTGLNLFELDPELRLIHWRWQPGQTDTGTSTKQALSETERAWAEQCRQSGTDTIQLIHEDLAESALLTAQNIRTGGVEPLINLRRDALDVSDRLHRVRWHVNAVMASVAVLLLALSGIFLWRAHEYSQADLRYNAAISDLFHETYGDQPIPISVRRRLNTRLRELQGLAGQQFDEVESTEKVSALWLLHDLLERIPSDQRLCLLNIKIEHDYISLNGQARSHSEADRIAAALRRDERFEVDQPSTSNQKEGGVSFSLHCIPNDNAVADPPNPPHNTKPTSRIVTTGETLP